MSESLEKCEIKILCITDTHHYVRNMNLLKEKLEKEKKLYDLVIHTGDFDSIKNEDLNNFYNLPLKERDIADEKVKFPLSIFKEFSKSKTILFITGNHDSRNFDNICHDGISYYDNVKYLSSQCWFQRMQNGSLLPIVCTSLGKSYKIKEYVSVYVKPDIIKLRKLLENSLLGACKYP